MRDELLQMQAAQQWLTSGDSRVSSDFSPSSATAADAAAAI